MYVLYVMCAMCCRCIGQAAEEAIGLIAKELRKGKIGALDFLGDTVEVSKGPMAAVGNLRLREYGPQEKAKWKEVARIRAILGSSAKSLSSLRSGIRCWFKFKGELLGLSCVTHCMRGCTLHHRRN